MGLVDDNDDNDEGDNMDNDLVDAVRKVIDRLEAWHDSARIANLQCPSSDMRNTMINYAHLIDVLTDALRKGG
jgi:hypothetical protein